MKYIFWIEAPIIKGTIETNYKDGSVIDEKLVQTFNTTSFIEAFRMAQNIDTSIKDAIFHVTDDCEEIDFQRNFSNLGNENS